jgi:hypothetical protein
MKKRDRQRKTLQKIIHQKVCSPKKTEEGGRRKGRWKEIKVEMICLIIKI